MPIDEKAAQDLPSLLAGGDTVDSLYAELRASFDQERKGLGSEQQLKTFRDRWLGRKNGLLAQTNEHWLKRAPREFKPQVGKRQNQIKRSIEEAVVELKEGLERAQQMGEQLDVTLPGPPRQLGAQHPIRRVFDEIQDIFRTLGYSIAEGPEIETYYYNFEALNFPPDHPAVDEMDTLFIEDQILLRTHTSPNQIRIMERESPPVRYIVPGKVYRHDTADSTHSPMFHQIEGFAVGEDITFGDLKGTLDYFLKHFFGPEIKTRFRPSFFPFTEPSAEVDISCIFCAGKGCRICKDTGFIEVLGCGMIDPEVFRHVGYDPERYAGFAFGLGIDRFTMLKYDIDDIQLFFQGDVRFLRQFR
jgi:phenylalanyl-tRNA synthetase alpha chain